MFNRDFVTGASLVILPSLPLNNVCDLGHCKMVGFFSKENIETFNADIYCLKTSLYLLNIY